MAAKILPFRDYSEHEVLNFFTFNGTIPVTAGTLVKIDGSGMNNDTWKEAKILGDAGQAYSNVISKRYGVYPQVCTLTSNHDTPIGMLLYDVRENDENGEKLIYNPQKAAENNWAISGQAVPILTRGVVLYSGYGGTPSGGQYAYPTGDGTICSDAIVGSGTQCGKWLGAPDSNGWAFLKLEL